MSNLEEEFRAALEDLDKKVIMEEDEVVRQEIMIVHERIRNRLYSLIIITGIE